MKTTNVFIITGNEGEGKTTKLMEVIRLLNKKGQNIFGFYAIGEWENGLRSRFHVKDVQSGKSYLLCSRQESLGTNKGQFVFSQQTIMKGEQIIANGMKHQKALAVIDEVGRFEIAGKVWYSVFYKLLKNNFPVLITVRKKLLMPVIEKFDIEQPEIFSLNEKCTLIADKIIDQLSQNEKSEH